MKLLYVKVLFEGTTKKYNYYTTDEVNIGDCAIVYAPRGIQVVTVTDIVPKNSVANQPLLGILSPTALKDKRNKIQAEVEKFKALEKEILQRIAAIDEKAIYNKYAELDPEIGKLLKQLSGLSG